MTRCTWLLGLGFLTASFCLGAEETYTIRFKEISSGDVTHMDRNSTEKTSTTLTDRDGNKITDKDQTTVRKFVYQSTILEKPKDSSKPTKLRRHYETAEVKVDEDRRTLPYQGKTVVIEKNGDRYQFAIEGGQALTGNDAEDLEQEFNKAKGDALDLEKLILPKKPVRVNESWKIDPSAFLKALAEGAFLFDSDKAAGSAKLLKAYRKEGRLFGVLELRFTAPLKSFSVGDQKFSVDDGAKIVFGGQMDGCIDGSLSEGTGKAEMKLNLVANIEQGGNKFKLTLKVGGNQEQTGKEVANK